MPITTQDIIIGLNTSSRAKVNWNLPKHEKTNSKLENNIIVRFGNFIIKSFIFFMIIMILFGVFTFTISFIYNCAMV
jgi:hypothetical protein